MEFDKHGLKLATYVTPSDIRVTRSKLIATVPPSGTKWRSMLLQLTNLLRKLFLTRCPMYEKMAILCKALQEYPQSVIDTLPLSAKASILWIVHLQCRHFAQGFMYSGSPQGELLPAFTLMLNEITAGKIHMVSHAGVPHQLLAVKRTPPTPDDNFTPDPKKHKVTDQNKNKDQVQHPWNDKLKEALTAPLRAAKYPSLKQICRFCDLPERDPVVTATGKQCRAYLIFGTCRYGKKCRYAHDTCTDEQAEQILGKFKTFLEKPEDLGKN